MELRVLVNDKKNNKLSFMLKDSNTAFANALRRTIINRVPTMAIEDVEIRKNSSVLYDEVIAHRLGLTVLKTDLKGYNLPNECKCEGKGCASCQVKLALKAKGPKTVYASDIKSKDPGITPVFESTPIVKLLKNQELELEATATLGLGMDHIKWSPALVWYKYKPNVEIAKEIENKEEVAQSCPVSVFDYKNGKITVNKDTMLNCTLCEACIDLVRPKDAIKLNESDKDFIFFLESWGGLAPKEILNAAADIIEAHLDDFEKSLKKA